MCGRFLQTADPADYAAFLHARTVVAEPLAPSWNVAPTNEVYTAAVHAGERLLGTMRWGLVPHWSKDGRPGPINARSETAATRPMFRDLFRSRRCLVPADGFYEWERRDGRSVPYWIRRADGYPLAIAGLWSTWRDPDTGAAKRTCVLLTRPAAGPVARIHDRMPVVLHPEAWSRWLDPEVRDPGEVAASMQMIEPAELLVPTEIVPLVNSVRNNGPELLAAAHPPT